MSELPKAYEPNLTEAKWYSYWLEQRCFEANPKSSKPAYSIVIPPPNVTGILHLGHVLNNTIQDILCRKARMEGKEVLWLPGTDHAGIATQVVVEKRLKKEEGKSRHDVGRKAFVERIWAWKEKHGGIIIDQLKKLGCSCDWTRERFTMDEDYSRTVAETFVDLHQKGLIYKGKRMVNWCPVSHTALSDEEVIMKPQKGLLYYFKVEVIEKPGTFLTIATTRPETIPGDTGVAVNPKDERYAQYIGMHVRRPLPNELPEDQKKIPIVADEHVDFEFGTGVLKVTPAHDPADFDIGKRHNLAFIEVINHTGKMSPEAGRDLEGLDRVPARKKAAELLIELGLMEKEEPYENNVGFSERADVPIEPRLSEQWFFKYPCVSKAQEVVDSGELKFYPDRWSKVYNHWMNNIRDWCISRQLWWGHRIPVWYRNEEVKCQIESPGEEWEQDPDVLDTWFSSWLWPFATMDEATRKKFYPTTDMVTAPEILFFWVARMIMSGFEYTGVKPFTNVYLTGIVRDKLGRKMSKSLGNSPDPVEIIDQFGADALRFGIMRSAPVGQDLRYDIKQVELGRNFCNKLWNASRFRQMQGGKTQEEIDPARLSSEDRWILLKLDSAIGGVTKAMESYNFYEVMQILYRFFWNEFCDWHLESIKAAIFSGDELRKANTVAVLDFVLSHTLRLFHPFLPFITEELWHGLGYQTEMPENQGKATISFAPWPKSFDEELRNHFKLDDAVEKYVESIHDLVIKTRNLRRECNVPNKKKIGFIFNSTEAFDPNDQAMLANLLNAKELDLKEEYEGDKGTPSVRCELGDLFMPLDGLIDVEAEKARLSKDKEKIKQEIQKVEGRLNNPKFKEKAPPEVLEEHETRLNEWRDKLSVVENALVSFD
ncbi:MAG TPA: valine--tRNA ligase [Verrucomicrobiales bacterium]|nr:valine--tRNA ligase [Verrucomicrobiales bacterium]